MDIYDSTEELKDYLKNHHEEIAKRYSAAIREVCVKLTALKEDFRVLKKRDCISTIQSRIKSDDSILKKLSRKKLPVNLASVYHELDDIAGIRVVCKFIDDIYTIAERLKTQGDFEIIQTKDYIKNPKPNGYRSYHMILSVPVTVENITEKVSVELQLRTVAMDFWASLEHDIKYKKDSCECNDIVDELKFCADTIAAADLHMMELRDKVSKKRLQYKQFTQ